MVVTDPNHDPEQKALAVEESLANLEYYNNNSSRSLTGYEVLKENSGVWDVIATTGETMYSDQGLATSTGESYYQLEINVKRSVEGTVSFTDEGRGE